MFLPVVILHKMTPTQHLVTCSSGLLPSLSLQNKTINQIIRKIEFISVLNTVNNCLRFPYKIMQIATAGGSWGPIVDIGERFHCFMLIYANETN